MASIVIAILGKGLHLIFIPEGLPRLVHTIDACIEVSYEDGGLRIVLYVLEQKVQQLVFLLMRQVHPQQGEGLVLCPDQVVWKILIAVRKYQKIAWKFGKYGGTVLSRWCRADSLVSVSCL